MSVPTIDELYMVRDAIEPALAEVLATATGATVHRTQDGDPSTPKQTPRIELELDPGKSNGHLYPCPDGNCREDMWEGSLTIRVVTERTKTGQRAAHMALRAKIVSTLSTGNGLFPDGALPYHELVDCRQDGQPFSVESANGFDVSEISFSVVTGIKSSALDGVEATDQLSLAFLLAGLFPLAA